MPGPTIPTSAQVYQPRPAYQPQPATFAVIVPQGVGPGMQLVVRAPNTGQQMRVIVPQGVGPGMQFLCPMPQAQPQYGYQQPPRYY